MYGWVRSGYWTKAEGESLVTLTALKPHAVLRLKTHVSHRSSSTGLPDHIKFDTMKAVYEEIKTGDVKQIGGRVSDVSNAIMDLEFGIFLFDL